MRQAHARQAVAFRFPCRREPRIAITPAAFEAIAATLLLGSVGYENPVNEKGECLVWLAPEVVDRLRAMRGPGESYSDVIFEGGGGGLVASLKSRLPIPAFTFSVIRSRQAVRAELRWASNGAYR